MCCFNRKKIKFYSTVQVTPVLFFWNYTLLLLHIHWKASTNLVIAQLPGKSMGMLTDQPLSVLWVRQVTDHPGLIHRHVIPKDRGECSKSDSKGKNTICFFLVLPCSEFIMNYKLQLLTETNIDLVLF